MSDRNCPGLARCGEHPRWHVVWLFSPRGWNVFKSENDHIETFPTHADAMSHAQKEATK